MELPASLTWISPLRPKCRHAWSRETEGYFQAITEHSLVAVSIVRDGRFVYANRKVLDILGYGAEELLGMADLLELIYPDDRAVVRENLRRRLEGEVKTLSYEDVNSGARYPDVVAVGGFTTPAGNEWHIPYGALVPKKVDNLLTSGRCISAALSSSSRRAPDSRS